MKYPRLHMSGRLALALLAAACGGADGQSPASPAGADASSGSLAAAVGSGAGVSAAVAGQPSLVAGSAAASGSVTYQGQIRPLIESNCLECHVVGGRGAFPLDSWSQVMSAAPTIVGAVVSGIMPPSNMKRDCPAPDDVRRLTQEQKDLFSKWRDTGYAEGSERDYVAPRTAAGCTSNARP